MPSRDAGDQPDPAAELLGRWQAHHDTASTENSDPGQSPEPSSPSHRPRHAAPRPAGRRARREPVGRAFDQTEAGREVVEALGGPPPAKDVSREPEQEPEAPAPTSPRAGRAAAGVRTDVTFAPRMFGRRVLALLLLLLVGSTGIAGLVAYDDPSTLTIGLAGTLLVVTLAVYAIRAAAVPTVVAIHGGQLEVVRGRDREIFDLTSRYTRIEEVGTPGRRGWKVLLGRFGKEPLVIDSSAVDPRTFSAELGRLRPPPRAQC